VDIPGDVPDLWIDQVEEAGALHLLFEDGAVAGREGFHGDKEVGSGREPLGAVLGESTAWDNVVDVGVVRELPAPSLEDTGETREIGADETRVLGEVFEGGGRSLERGVVGRALMRADKGAQGLRDGEG